MFKIGDFSKLTHVSVKTLHHYDDIGLFKPLRVDPFTGYRYYSFDQLPRLNRILALRDLGFPLEQIGRMVDENLTAEQLEGMLLLRQAELRQEIEAAQERLAQVQIRLHHIRQEGKMAQFEIVLKKVEGLKVIAAREVVPTPEQMRARCQALIDEVCQVMEQTKITTDGTCLALYHDHSTAGIDVEMAFFVDNSTLSQQHGRVVVHDLPVETMAAAVYRGSYDDFAAVGQLHVDIGKWIEANGYHLAGPSREIYLKTPDQPGGEGLMELQYPVAKG